MSKNKKVKKQKSANKMSLLDKFTETLRGIEHPELTITEFLSEDKKYCCSHIVDNETGEYIWARRIMNFENPYNK